ncbi:MAG: pyridoxine 5'-phosphate synthase [Hyphomicrobiales bacterium]|nr:pyridoxine 5'-phosphate synthase [Hyphomicrobiales bacterium]
MTARLSVNVNAIAYLRNRRDLPWPDVTEIGRIALEAGAHGLTVHPRPDERHIRRTDVSALARLIAAEFPDREHNIEGNPQSDFIELVETARPAQVTLVPDDAGQSTSDHGWNIAARRDFLSSVVARFKRAGIRVSLFVDAQPENPSLAKAVGADRIEIFTGPYGATFDKVTRVQELAKVTATAHAARDLGLEVNAGHDLTLDNLPPLVAAVPHLAEVSIGHALTADALRFGMAEAVFRYRQACGEPI